VGVSRKAFIGEVLGRRTDDRLMGTAAAVAIAVFRGAGVVRVHDVKAMQDVVRMVYAIQSHASR
jgi:dihydropteroate synthase